MTFGQKSAANSCVSGTPSTGANC